MRWRLTIVRFVLFALAVAATPAVADADTLASWQDGSAKARITAFVNEVTKPGGPNFVEPTKRIAVFDNDGTLWAEKPTYFQLAFTMDRIKTLAPLHPEWKTRQPFEAALEGDHQALAAAGQKGLLELFYAANTGMTTDQYTATVTSRLASARHPRCKCQYTDLVYAPMVELLTYLRSNGFKTYIVTGGSVEFVRAFAVTVYGVPPEQVIGTTFVTQLDSAGGRLVIKRAPKIEFVNDGPGKPVAISRVIGRRPIFAFGNSDGDWQMLQWTAATPGAHFAALLHHTDSAREWAYDRTSRIGKLDKALDDARAKDWLVVDTKHDWRTVFSHAPVAARSN